MYSGTDLAIATESFIRVALVLIILELAFIALILLWRWTLDE